MINKHGIPIKPSSIAHNSFTTKAHKHLRETEAVVLKRMRSAWEDEKNDVRAKVVRDAVKEVGEEILKAQRR